MSYCTRCGTQIPDGEFFCPKCGQAVFPGMEDFSKEFSEMRDFAESQGIHDFPDMPEMPDMRDMGKDKLEEYNEAVLWYGIISALMGSLGIFAYNIYDESLIGWVFLSAAGSGLFALLAWKTIDKRDHFALAVVLMLISSLAAILTIVLFIGGIVMTVRLFTMRKYFVRRDGNSTSYYREYSS